LSDGLVQLGSAPPGATGGSLASATTPKLIKHKGRAVVFRNIDDFPARIDDPKLDIDEHCVMVLQNCGPKGYRSFRIAELSLFHVLGKLPEPKLAHDFY
jgi:hypothetical protein